MTIGSCIEAWVVTEDVKEVVQVIMNYKEVRTGDVDDGGTAAMLQAAYF